MAVTTEKVVVLTDETGASLDWVATQKALPSGVSINYFKPARWLREAVRDQPEFGIPEVAEVELQLTWGGAEIGHWEGRKGEQVRAVIDLLREADLPVVEG